MTILMFLIKPKYVMDTCSLTAMRRVYPFDVFPGAWKKLDGIALSGTLISTEDVFMELEEQDDVVYGWAKKHSYLFLPLDAETQIETANILKSYPNLLDRKKKKSSADPFLIACAKINACSLVTEERPSGGPEKMKIPDVCKEMGIECISILEVCRREGLRL